MQIIHLAASAAGCALVLASALKVSSPAATEQSVNLLLSGRWRISPFWVSSIEALAGVAAIVGLGWKVQWLALPAAFLYALFALLLSRMLLRGTSFACNCFGASDHPTTWMSVIADIGAAVALVLATVVKSNSLIGVESVAAGFASVSFVLLFGAWRRVRSQNSAPFVRRGLSTGGTV